MCGHDLPANIGEAHPGLHLAADHVLPAHLIDKGDRGDIATNGDDINPQALLLAAWSRWTRYPVRVDTIKPVASCLFLHRPGHCDKCRIAAARADD
jgi:hypothetical protein